MSNIFEQYLINKWTSLNCSLCICMVSMHSSATSWNSRDNHLTVWGGDVLIASLYLWLMLYERKVPPNYASTCTDNAALSSSMGMD